jgi:uncharacterized protein YcbK (DUF882 family)
VRHRARATVLARLALAAVLFAGPAAGVGAAEDRTLSFVHTHTRERITVTYWSDGAYRDAALADLRQFLRDFRTGDSHDMDAALFDILYALKQETGTTEPFQVISAYRSPRSNSMLRSAGRGVAEGSLHMQGRAMDIRLADVKSSRVRDVALELKRGGVGYYAKSDFVHVDTGRVRRW